jgi:hypothetical protein
MKVFLNLISVGLLLVLLVGTGLSITYQNNSGDPLTFSNLTFEIIPTKDGFLPLEPIPLILELRNRTKNPVSGHKGLDFSQNHIELFVVGSNASVNKIEIKNPVTKLVEPASKVYEPGEVYQSKRQLITNNRSDVLSQPGEYRIQAVIHGTNWYEEIKSNLLTVRIIEAKGVDKQAFDFLKGSASVSELFAGFDLSQDQNALGMFERLTNNFGETVYAEYASFRLGEFYFARKEYTKAKQDFEKVANKSHFVFAGRASKYLDDLNAH